MAIHRIQQRGDDAVGNKPRKMLGRLHRRDDTRVDAQMARERGHTLERKSSKCLK
jgi:hypothetical protein